MSLTEENIKWNDEYSIGDKEIDREFKKLFDIAKKALCIQSLENEDDIISDVKIIIDELTFYVSTHFVIEQEYMRNLQYPKIDQHIKLHKTIISNLNAFISNLNHLSFEEVKEQLFYLIKTNFIDHIIHEDKKITQWENSLDSAQKTFDWDNSFELGESKLDEENKRLFEMATQAFNQANDIQREKKIRILVTYLYDYMKHHLRYEEAIMNEIEYPKLAQHMLIHKKIISQVNHYVAQLPKANNLKEFEKGLATMIENTLIFHVMDQDEHFRQWYKIHKI